jgi:hypothetical protein
MRNVLPANGVQHSARSTKLIAGIRAFPQPARGVAAVLSTSPPAATIAAAMRPSTTPRKMLPSRSQRCRGNVVGCGRLELDRHPMPGGVANLDLPPGVYRIVVSQASRTSRRLILDRARRAAHNGVLSAASGASRPGYGALVRSGCGVAPAVRASSLMVLASDTSREVTPPTS